PAASRGPGRRTQSSGGRGALVPALRVLADSRHHAAQQRRGLPPALPCAEPRGRAASAEAPAGILARRARSRREPGFAAEKTPGTRPVYREPSRSPCPDACAADWERRPLVVAAASAIRS